MLFHRPTTEEKKSDKKALQVEEKHHNLSLLQEELRTCRNDLETKDREIESLIERLATFNFVFTFDESYKILMGLESSVKKNDNNDNNNNNISVGWNQYFNMLL